LSLYLDNIIVLDGVEEEMADGVTVMEVLNFPGDTELLRDLIRSERVRMLIFDPLISYTSSDVNIIDTLDVRHLLDPLAQLARDEDIAIVATIHFSKRTEGDFITRVSGSRQFTDTARSVFTVLVEGRKDGGEVRRWIASAKLNLDKCPVAIPFFIEDVVSGQERFVRFRDRRAWLQQSSRIMKRLSAPLVSVYETNEQPGATNTRLEPLQDLEILRNELRFEEKVLRRIAGNGEFRRNDQFCSRGRKSFIGASNLLKIAAQIPDDGIDLSETDLHAVRRKLCAARRSAIPFEPDYGLEVRLTAGDLCW
jgi:hypothetical protein